MLTFTKALCNIHFQSEINRKLEKIKIKYPTGAEVKYYTERKAIKKKSQGP